MRILVTGGAGFIGSVATNFFVERNFQVKIIDNFSTGSRKFIPKNVEVIDGDIRDEASLTKASESCDVILHLAGLALVSESVKKSKEYFSVNHAGTKLLLQVAEKMNIKSIIFASTCAVYGDDIDQPISENITKAPCNPYGESKLLAENEIHDWQKKESNRRAVIFRFFNVSGAYLSQEFGLIGENRIVETHLIPNLVRDKMAKFNLFGTDFKTPDGTAVRDYIHVKDLCTAFLLGIEHSLKNSGIWFYNLGSGNGQSVLEVIETYEKIIGRKVNVVKSARREGDPNILVAEISKVTKELKWKPEFGLSEILKSTSSFFNSNIIQN